jgi:hypothetical protein
MATDGLRPIGLALQTTANTAVPPTVEMNWPGDWEWNPNVNTTVIRSKNNVRTQETRVRVNTKYDEVMFRGASLDLYEFLNVLAITFGVPASGVYKYGAANNGTAGNYGTLKFAYGLAESWQLYNCRGNTLTIQGDAANGTLTYDAGVRGIKSASQPGGAWAPTRSIPTGDAPFDAWQFTITKGGVSPGCVENFRLDFNNHFDALFCFPSTAPTSTTEAGIAPSRFKDGLAEARFNITIEYTGYAGSSFKDFMTKVHGPWQLTATDANAVHTGSPGTLVFDLLDVGFTNGNLDGSQDEVRQVLQAAMLFSPSDTTSVKATATLPT